MSQTVEELRARLERTQTIIDNIPALVAYWNRHQRCEFLNRAYRDWFGLEPSNLVGVSLEEVLGERLYALNRPYIEAALRGEPQSFERVLTDQRGVDRHTQISYVPDLHDGEVRGFCVLISDMTERKRAEAQALDAHAQLQALLHAVQDHIYALDQEGRILYANRTLQAPLQSVLGTQVEQYFPEPQRGGVRRALEAAFSAHQVSHFESTVNIGEAKLWFHCQISPVVRDGKTESALLVASNITARKHIETQLAAAERMAAVGSLAAGVAHEINTPVQFVSDSVQFVRESSADLFAVLEKLLALQRAVDDPAQAQTLAREAAARIEEADLPYLIENLPRAVERSLQGLKRVAEIVSALKAFSHPDTNRMVEAQLEDVIENTLTLAAHEYKYAAEIVRDYVELPPVRCHVGGISQVVLNIVVNAAHAIEEKNAGKSERGLITLRTRRDGDDYVVIAIQDTGGGIPEAIRARVFDPFFTTKAVGKGTGQGLAISWSIVTEEHRGQLWFESELGEGTTFFVRLPIEPQRASRDSRTNINRKVLARSDLW